MNILDITNEDIARLQENKIVFGLLPERDREIFKTIGKTNCNYLTCRLAWDRVLLRGKFDETTCYRIKPDYTLPAPTEAEIIKYLQASEVPPSQWPKVVQEWAKRHDENGVWECKLTTGVWAKTVFITSPVSGAWYSGPHRLRADYRPIEHFSINVPVIGPKQNDAKEPEVCVWKYNGIVGYHFSQCAHNYYDPSMNHKRFEFCPYCGKRIEAKE